MWVLFFLFRTAIRPAPAISIIHNHRLPDSGACGPTRNSLNPKLLSPSPSKEDKLSSRTSCKRKGTPPGKGDGASRLSEPGASRGYRPLEVAKRCGPSNPLTTRATRTAPHSGRGRTGPRSVGEKSLPRRERRTALPPPKRLLPLAELVWAPAAEAARREEGEI